MMSYDTENGLLVQKKYDFFKPQVMGILNVTPDSFFEGSRKQTERDIATRADEIISEGGSIIDVGGYSTRPGASEVSEEEELQRVRFALEIIRHNNRDACISVDTFRPAIARMSVEEFGVDIINDVSGGSEEMFRMVTGLNVTYILMSTQPTMEKMKASFTHNLAQLKYLGHADIILDPGYGFGKNVNENYEVLRRQKELTDFGLPILAGVSRKRMIWQLLDSSPDGALNGTIAANTIALMNGASILRVHDVREAYETIKITEQCLSR